MSLNNPPRAFIRDLDSLPFPAWHLLDLERYKLPLMGEKFLILSPVRGCPYPTCNSRVDTVDQEMLSAMADAGCWMISYGIESGNQRILDQIKKKITLAQSREAVKAATNAGIRTAGHFVIGFPGETEESLRDRIMQ